MKQFFCILICIPNFLFSADTFASSLTKIKIKRQSWEKSSYIWNFGVIMSADKGLDRNPEQFFATETIFDKKKYENLKAGDIVFVHCRFIPQFYQEVVPSLAQPIVLVIADGDESFPTDCGNNFDVEKLLSHHCIVHVFVQNNVYAGKSKKVLSLPIGMDFHTVAYKGANGGWGEKGSPKVQEAQLNDILATLKPTYLRKKRIFTDFQLADTMHGEFKRYLQCGEDRKSIFQRILKTGLVDYAPSFMRRSKLWETKGEYAFSVSPHGNGLDCHRTWEDLVLGCIVIVKSSPLDSLYEGLPVVIVQDWSEITAENLDAWLAKFGNAFTNQSYRIKLTNRYWISKIEAIANRSRDKSL